MAEFGDMLSELRHDRNLTQAELALKIYVKLVDCLEKCLIYRHIRRFAD